MEKKTKMLVTCHLILMGVLCVLSCVSAGIIFSGHIPEGYGVVTEAQKNASNLIGIGHIVNVLALICGIAYMLKGGSKSVAGLYKAFLMFVAVGLALRLAGRIVSPGFDVAAGLMIACILLLLMMTFVKDLGRTKTWCVYHLLIILELVVVILIFDSREVFSSIASGLTRLVLEGTIGLAVRAKYRDKAARGK